MSKIITTESFINKANLKHHNKYDYSNTIYVNSRKKLSIFCNTHGIFNLTPNSHYSGNGCPSCGRKKVVNSRLLTQTEVINRMNKLHHFKYDYSKLIYKNIFKKVIIICPIHGQFLQTPHGHLHSKGCKQCNHQSVYTKTSWISVCNSKKELPIVYIIRCFNKTEQFIKIGKTSLVVIKRFCGKNNMPYSYEIVKEIKGLPDFIWDKEIDLQKKYKNFSYSPLIQFGGSKQECFNTSILEEVLKHL